MGVGPYGAVQAVHLCWNLILFQYTLFGVGLTLGGVKNGLLMTVRHLGAWGPEASRKPLTTFDICVPWAEALGLREPVHVGFLDCWWRAPYFGKSLHS